MVTRTYSCVYMHIGIGWSHRHVCTHVHRVWVVTCTHVHGVWVVTWVDVYTHVHGVWEVTWIDVYMHVHGVWVVTWKHMCTHVHGICVVTHTCMYTGAWMSGCLGPWCDDVEGRRPASTPRDGPSFLSQGRRSRSPSRPSYLPQSLEEWWWPRAMLETGRSQPREEAPWVSNLCK